MIKVKSGFFPTIPLTHSRLCIDNIVKNGTVTASSETTGFPAIAAANPLTYNYWKPATLPATWTVDAGSAKPVGYVGIASHDLGEISATVAVEYSLDNSTWVQVDSLTPTDNSPIIFLFEPITARYWRLNVSGTSPFIGVVYIGMPLEMQRPCFAGLNPIDLTRNTTIRPNVSVGGQWLGRSVIRQGNVMSIAFQNLGFQWYKQNFDPFVELARTDPFFFAWRPDGYPASVGYVWVNSDISPTTSGKRDLVDVGFTMEGLSFE
jgi:hypothetical protein